jgi:hypothetical protein
MRFRVSGFTEICPECFARRRTQQPLRVREEVKAVSEDSAKDAFMAKKRLCKPCKQSGADCNLQFDRAKLLCAPLEP